VIDTPQIVSVPARQTAAIRITVPRAKIQSVMGVAMQEVMKAVAAQGIAPAGPMFSYHLQMPGAVFDLEVGVPVQKPIAETGRVLPSTLPAGRVARTIYHGPYESLGAGWGQFGTWLATQNLKPGPTLWESYLTGPQENADPAAWRTELNRPLIG
jgi:effector-binding domain-containing protein